MQDIRIKIDAFRAEAEDCDLIAKLATSPQKRDLFTQLARRFRQMVDDLEAVLRDPPKKAG